MTRFARAARPGAAALAALAAVAFTTFPVLAQPSTHPGRQIYVDSGCQNCHGNRGQGGVSIDFPKGPSLRTSALDPGTMTEIVKCGIPGTRMPAWLEGAYTEVECHGELGAPPPGMTVPAALTAEQIDTLVEYIFDELVQTPQP